MLPSSIIQLLITSLRVITVFTSCSSSSSSNTEHFRVVTQRNVASVMTVLSACLSSNPLHLNIVLVAYPWSAFTNHWTGPDLSCSPFNFSFKFSFDSV